MAGLFLLPVEESKGLLGANAEGGEGALTLQAPPGAYLLSLELWNPGGRWASRIRHGIRAGALPPDVPSLSDFLLLDPGDSLPADLAEALSRARTTTDLRSGDRVTLAWEVYGLGQRREPLTFRVSMVREDGSFLRRAFERIGLFRRSPALTLTWSEGGSESPDQLFRSVDVVLPDMDVGRYVLHLELDIPFRNRIRATRRIRIH
jgi:hypothetical protein